MGVTDTGISGERDFPATSWSIIRQAKDPRSPQYERHLRRLVELYWKPVYFAIRHAWPAMRAEARDLTQEFFATAIFEGGLVQSFAPERGSFRGLLRAAVTNFMRNAVRDAGRKKRGAEFAFVPLDDDSDDGLSGVPDEGALTPEEVFDRAWNRLVVARALALLEAKLADEGKAISFEVFKRHDLEDEAHPSYAAIGAAVGLSEAQVKHALRHARSTLRQIVTDLVRDYVDGAAGLADELRAVLGA